MRDKKNSQQKEFEKKKMPETYIHIRNIHILSILDVLGSTLCTQQVMHLCAVHVAEWIESAQAVNRFMAQSSSLERTGKQTNASHYCTVLFCRALGKPSQSTQIQLLLLNQFEAAATSHLSQ